MIEKDMIYFNVFFKESEKLVIIDMFYKNKNNAISFFGYYLKDNFRKNCGKNYYIMVFSFKLSYLPICTFEFYTKKIIESNTSLYGKHYGTLKLYTYYSDSALFNVL
jgi:hypothetical protein